MWDEIDKLSDALGLEFDDNGNHIIRIFDEDVDTVAKTLGFGTLNELLQHQVDNENYEGAETLKQVIARKHEIQEIQRNRKLQKD